MEWNGFDVIDELSLNRKETDLCCTLVADYAHVVVRQSDWERYSLF